MQLRNPKELKKWSQNPKTQTKEQYARMLERYKEYGQLTAFLVMPDGTILGGNHGLQAVIELDMQAKCIPVDFIQEGDEWFFVNDGEIQRQVPYKSKEEGMIKVSTAHNERFSQYDPDALANLIGNYHIDMPDYSFDFTAQMTLGELGKQEAEVVEDEAPAVSPEPAVSKLGEVYQLGRHRLMCGDSTKKEDVERLMNGQKADMVFTDPPYNAAIGSTQKNVGQDAILNNDMSDAEFISFIGAFMTTIHTATKPDAFWYICCNWVKYHIFKEITEKTLKKLHSLIVWVKDLPGMGYGYRSSHEFILFASDNDSVVFDDKTERNVWMAPASNSGAFRKDNLNGESKVIHPTMKPISLCARAIKNTSKKDNIILDVFGGSGSTLIACEQTNRICYMMELDPKYCDVIRKRYATFTKQDDWQSATPLVTI